MEFIPDALVVLRLGDATRKTRKLLGADRPRAPHALAGPQRGPLRPGLLGLPD